MDVAAARQALLDVTHGLVREYEGDVPAGSVIRCVVRCRDELLLLGLREGLVDAVDAMARRRLEARGSRTAAALPGPVAWATAG